MKVHRELVKRSIPLDMELEKKSENTVSNSSMPCHAEDNDGLRPDMTSMREVLLICLLCSTQLLTQASVGMVLVPLHIIGDTFSSPASTLAWPIAAHSLTVGTFVLPSGRLGDIYGHGKLLITGWTWFGVWSVIAGASSYSHSTVVFNICRAFQGIGPAILLPNALAVAGRTYKNGSATKRGVFAAVGAMAPIGALLGAVVGSGFAQLGCWEVAFYLHAAGCAALAVLACFVVPQATIEEKAINKTKTFDWIGSCLGVAGLVLVNFAWNQAVVVGWSTTYVYALLITGLAFMVAFGISQKVVKDPLLPPGIFNLSAVMILICVALGWSSFGIWFYYSFNLIEVIRGFSPLAATAQFAPEVISGVCAAMTTAYLLGKFSPGWLMTFASTAFFAGCLLVATSPKLQIYWANTFVSMCVMAWGMDISFPAASTSLSDIVPREHQGISASLVNTIVNYSVSIGLGIAGTVEMKVRESGESVFAGYRAALWTSVGLSGLGLIVSLAFALQRTFFDRAERRRQQV